jgi:acetamidase/formamidase
MANLALAALVALVTLGDSHTVAPSTYYRTFSRAHPVLKRVKPGDSVATKTIDSAGVDEKDVKRSEPFNPLTGPFFVEGAEPGDALVVKLTTLKMNRNWGWSAFRLGLFSITPEDVETVYSNQYKPDLVFKGRSTLVPWDIDLAKQTVKLREPKSAKMPMEFPAKPMLGCIGVAPPGDFAPTSGPSGAYGGNLDYNKIGQGATVILPVYHPGALLFVGDGHALQADGEPTGTGIETSMDIEFTVEVKKGGAPTGPRVETTDDLISIGSQPEFASALDNGLKMATSDMVKWLTKDYGLEPWAAHLLIGYQGKYDVVTVAGSMALRIPKSALPAPEPAPKAQEPKAEAKPEPHPILEKTAKLEKIDGFLPLYWDESGGKVLMEIPRFDREFLYQVTLTTGVGSNPIGLDRGQLGSTRVVTFRKVGPKVLLEEPNYRFRALSDNPDERKSVEQSFARSVLWGFKIEAEEAGKVLVDATAFFNRDAHGVADRLTRTKQGKYKVDDSRGGLDRPGLKAFPKNTEVEATLTFATDDEPGPLVAQTAPAPRSITVRERHSLVELPDLNSGYTPRKLDPRVGVFGIEFADFATPTGTPIETRWISRHRLIKKDPKLALSEPVTPILYYVDRGAPEPIRSALVEGASWWSKAFEAAGFKDAFKVEVLPEGADPMDLRYNVIHWVHRSTRGWSYGNGIVDPRTGEILKGSVALDSQRARQDALIGAGLVPSTSGCGMMMPPAPEYLPAPASELASMVLARIRQLSAHEVGHTLGFAHNFAASTYDRGSVMDYPAPLVKIQDGKLDLSDAYARGIGKYDEFATRFAYAQFPPGSDETKGLNQIVEAGLAEGLLFLSDDDARPAGAAHPLANLWDNGPDPVAMLRHEMKVRRIALANFGLGNLAEGAPLSDLESKFLPLYLHHRYQLMAAVKTLGGVEYTNAVKSASGPSPSKVAVIVPADRQKEALEAILETLDPEELKIPSRILDLIPPTAFGHEGGTAELFTKQTGPTFDPLAAATVAADLAISALLQPQRAARLIEFEYRDIERPGFDVVLEKLHQTVWKSPPGKWEIHGVRDAIRHLHATRLMELAANDAASPQVRARATVALRKILDQIAPDLEHGVFPDWNTIHAEITRFLNRPDATHRRDTPLPAPPGDPIGSR